MLIDKLRRIKRELSADQRLRRGVKIMRRLIVAGIVGLILYQLWDIGWREVLGSLPKQPLFYILFVVLYLTLPVGEVLIYRQVWPIRRFEGLKAFITKRVYNEEVMGYSGEFYLYLWARRRLGRPDVEILKNVRDNNILSAITSNSIAVILVGALIYAGQIEILHWIEDLNQIYLITGVVVTAVLAAVVVQFRKYLFDLMLSKAVVIVSFYLARFLFHHAVLVVQWMVVIPEVSLGIWFTFLATVVVMNRIPFLPSKDLLFVGAGIELSRIMNIATAQVAGMLLVSGVLAKVTNLSLFLIISYFSKDPEVREMAERREEASR